MVFRFESDSLRKSTRQHFSTQRDVRLQEVDAAGIVFFARVLEYASDAFTALCVERGIDLALAIRERQWGAPLTHVEADYYRPLVFGDRVEVALVAVLLEESQVTLGYRMTRPSDGVVAAVVQTRHVFVDARTFTRMPAPEALRSALAPLSGWPPHTDSAKNLDASAGRQGSA